MAKFGIGDSVRRVEDPRLLTGGGRYTDDTKLRPAGVARLCAALAARPCRHQEHRHRARPPKRRACT